MAEVVTLTMNPALDLSTQVGRRHPVVYVGTVEVTLWSAEVAVVSAMAAFNVQSGK